LRHYAHQLDIGRVLHGPSDHQQPQSVGYGPPRCNNLSESRQKKSAPTAAAVLHRRWRRSFRLGGPLTGAAICAARAPFREPVP
jgi:hypothetical protein